MRRSFVGAVVSALAVAAVVLAVPLNASSAPSVQAAAEAYTWRNVRIDGGGFVPGIVFNPTERNLIYARTDIGGAYRWEQRSQSWIPLLDWVDADRWGWNGVVSLATDPVQTNRVCAAVGMYTNDWDPNNGAILRSTDKGNTWPAFELPFKVGGNMPGRGMGERLAVDPNRNSVVYHGAEGGNGLWRSTDGGATWSRIWDWGSYPERVKKYTMDISSVPWLTFGANPQPPEETPKLGWMNESVEIDPHDSNRFRYGTGATIYGSTDLTRWDTGGTVTIRPMVKGLEETAVLDLVSPPSGAPLISGLGDIGGFRHTNLDAVPPMMFTQPVFTSTTSLDFAEANPSVLVRAGNFTDADRPNDSHVAFSTDGGANWSQGTEPGGINNGGTVAAAADGSRFVWAPGDVGQQVVRSVGFGNSWTASTGIPANAMVESDRVNPNRCYGLHGGRFYLSTDGGASFTASAASGLPSTGNVRFKALPGREGELWQAGQGGLWRSTDSGATFSKSTTVSTAGNIGFGRAAPGQTYPALYLFGTVGGQHGVYRSDDVGATWVRINDDTHQYGNAGDALTGDPRIYGRVYLGTNGRGILVADRVGGSPSPTPTGPSPSPTGPSPTPTPTGASPTPTTPPPSSGECAASYRIVGSWPGGFQGEVVVRNSGTSAIGGWTVGWTFANGQQITQLWGGTHTQNGATVSVRDAGYNGALTPGATGTVGFLASATGSNAAPATVSCTSR
ncbi:cellulose binding domain-containing protein [Micromonospora sp. FIMYZ51]|uniref:cellulose binding domain-containing protein n=1 Tax=Micromonospora sp. FIMYZ51 TaxID=3051832 RepID=UPI00311F28B9